MENVTLNRIEIRGRIGQEPRITRVADKSVARFCVATNEIYKDRNGDLREETTWHNVSAWADKSQMDLNQLKKGDMVSVTGRVRNVRYTSAEGDDRYFVEIVASRLVPYGQQS